MEASLLLGHSSMAALLLLELRDRLNSMMSSVFCAAQAPAPLDPSATPLLIIPAAHSGHKVEQPQ